MAETRNGLIPYQSPGAEAPFKALRLRCIWFGITAIALGTVLTRLPAMGVELAEGLIALILAPLAFRLHSPGWWGALAFIIAVVFCYGMTAFRLDQADLYKRAGFSEQQLAGMGLLQPTSRLQLVVGWVPVLAGASGYLIYVRKFFSGNSVAGMDGDTRKV